MKPRADFAALAKLLEGSGLRPVVDLRRFSAEDREAVLSGWVDAPGCHTVVVVTELGEHQLGIRPELFREGRRR